MTAIILEGLVFVASVAAMAALFFYALLRLTPLGRRLRQAGNRRRIERALALTCPIHGAQREDDLVLLPNGERLCPACYQEALHG
jgi:hypothetical protein